MKFLSRHKKWLLSLIVVFCLGAAVITLGFRYNIKPVQNAVGYIFTPIQKAISSAADWIGGRIEFFSELGRLSEENERLKQEIELLLLDNSRMRQLAKDSERVSELLEIDIEYPTVGAKVIAWDPGNWYDIFIIDKGEKDGLEINMAVIGANGLIGRIFETGYNYSRVISVIDDTSSIRAKCVRTDDEGFVKGDIYLMLEGKCRMEFIDAASEIAVGDEIVTSHLSGVYPPGITIGYVTEVKLDGNGTKSAIVEPNIDFRHLELVLVINKLFGHELLDEAPEITDAN